VSPDVARAARRHSLLTADEVIKLWPSPVLYSKIDPRVWCAMVATFQQQSTSPDGAASHPELCSAPRFLTYNAAPALAEPECPSASFFDSWMDDPNLGGAGRIDWHAFDPPWQPAASMTGPLVYRLRDPTSLIGLVQQVHLSSAGEKANVLSYFGTEEESADNGIRISSTNKQMLRSAPGSAPIAGIGSLPAPAPSGDEVLNLGDDNGNVECVPLSLLYNPYSIAFQYARLGCPHKATSATGRPCHHAPSRDTCDS